jgi:hypothetical protein
LKAAPAGAVSFFGRQDFPRISGLPRVFPKHSGYSEGRPMRMLILSSGSRFMFLRESLRQQSRMPETFCLSIRQLRLFVGNAL